MSYSQQNEEAYILEVCGDIKEANLLDIGAYHPTCFSNSRALIDRGWGGILIEPSPGPVRALVQEYGTQGPKIRVIAAAVGLEAGLVDIAVTDDAVSVAATDEAHLATWAPTGGYYGVLTVPVLTPRMIFDRFGGDFQFVNIDTEGTSVDIFAEILRCGPRPRCICLEHDARHVEIAQYAEQANYRQVHLNGTNVIFAWGAR